MELLKLDNVSTYYGFAQVLYDISLQAKKGLVTCILGRNGMGKTTIIHTIMNFTSPASGSIYFKGEDITKLRPYHIVRKGLALVPQGKRLFPSLSVAENLIIGQRKSNSGSPWSLERIYSIFPILKERAKMRACLLSGGEQQMLAVGRALMTNAELILMDEPSEGLAPLIVREIGGFIKQLRNEGVSFILVEQNLYLAFEVCDYAYIVDKGKIVHEATMEDFKNDKEVQSKYLLVKG